MTGEIRWRRTGLYGLILATTLIAAGCNPLTEEQVSMGNCYVSITADSGQGQSVSGQDAAESFIVQGDSLTLSSVSLKLVVKSSDNTTKPAGDLNVMIMADSLNTTSGTPVPTTPSNTQLGGINEYGVLDVSTISLTGPVFYNISLPAPLTLSAGQAYWVYVKGVSSNPVAQVYWEQSSVQQYLNGFAWVSGSVPTPKYNLLTMINC